MEFGELFDGGFAFHGVGAVEEWFGIDDLDGAAGFGVFGAEVAAVVSFFALLEIVGVSGVESAIGAASDVGEIF